MFDEQWIILGGPKASPTPKMKPTEAKKVDDYNVTVTTVVVDAVTSKPSVEVTIESPFLPTHESGSSTNSFHASSNGTYNGEKIHHFGNSTGIMTVDPLSVCYGPSVRPKTRFLLMLLFLLLFLFLFLFLFLLFFSCCILFIFVMLFM